MWQVTKAVQAGGWENSPKGDGVEAGMCRTQWEYLGGLSGGSTGRGG